MAATIVTYCTSRMLEHPKSKSTQPSVNLYLKHETCYEISRLPGYLGEHWVGPQVLAHHLLLVMTQDLYATQGSKEKRGCLNPKSILHESVFPGDQVTIVKILIH